MKSSFVDDFVVFGPNFAILGLYFALLCRTNARRGLPLLLIGAQQNRFAELPKKARDRLAGEGLLIPAAGISRPSPARRSRAFLGNSANRFCCAPIKTTAGAR